MIRSSSLRNSPRFFFFFAASTCKKDFFLPHRECQCIDSRFFRHCFGCLQKVNSPKKSLKGRQRSCRGEKLTWMFSIRRLFCLTGRQLLKVIGLYIALSPELCFRDDKKNRWHWTVFRVGWRTVDGFDVVMLRLHIKGQFVSNFICAHNPYTWVHVHFYASVQ